MDAKKACACTKQEVFWGDIQECLNTKSRILLPAENAGQDEMPLDLPKVSNWTPKVDSGSAQGLLQHTDSQH